MGATQSKESAVQELIPYTGRFKLDERQALVYRRLDYLLNEIINKPSMFDLTSLLGNKDQCANLFMILSTTLRKETQRLLFPDPATPGGQIVASYMLKDDYLNKYEKDRTRVLVCDKIAHFAIRYVTLLSALLASVYAAPREVELTTGSGDFSPNQYKMLKDVVVPMMGPAQLGQFLQEYDPIITWIKKDDRKLVYFSDKDSVVLDTLRGIVYMPLGQTSGVMRIDISADYTPPAASMPIAVQYGMPSALPGAYGYGVPALAQPAAPAPAAAQYPSPPPSFIGTERQQSGMSAVSVASRRRRMRTRGGRRGHAGRLAATRRRRARQAGGALLIFRAISLTPLSGGMAPLKFYFGNNGRLYTPDERAALAKMAPQEQETTAATMGALFADKIGEILRGSQPQYPLVPYVKKYEAKEVAINPKTAEDFKTMHAMLTDKTQEVCPAIHRGLMLSFTVEYGPVLQTLFCTDIWKGQPLTTTPAYSLLESLYYDKEPELRDPTSTEARMYTPALSAGARAELIATTTKFVGEKVATRSGTAEDSYGTLKFVDYSESLSAFCKKEPGNKKPVRTEAGIRIFADGHKRLKEQFVAHLAACGGIVEKVVSVYKSPEGDRRLFLAKVFETDPRGSLATLEAMIAEARALIAQHYLAVEMIYRDTLQQFAKHTAGEAPVAIP